MFNDLNLQERDSDPAALRETYKRINETSDSDKRTEQCVSLIQQKDPIINNHIIMDIYSGKFPDPVDRDILYHHLTEYGNDRQDKDIFRLLMREEGLKPPGVSASNSNPLDANPQPSSPAEEGFSREDWLKKNFVKLIMHTNDELRKEIHRHLRKKPPNLSEDTCSELRHAIEEQAETKEARDYATLSDLIHYDSDSASERSSSRGATGR
jgi:hypothetical protein